LDTSLAPTTVGLIYVNPEGLMGEPDPTNTFDLIRITFGKMGANKPKARSWTAPASPMPAPSNAAARAATLASIALVAAAHTLYSAVARPTCW